MIVGRFVTNARENRMQVVTIYEEGQKKKRIKREQKGPFMIEQLDRESRETEYKWANKKAERIEGWKKL